MPDKYSMNSNGPGRHKSSNIVPARLVHKITVLTPEYLLPYRWAPGLTHSLYLADRPNRCSHCTEVWQKNLSDMLQSNFARFAPSQKSRHHNRSCVWTEALSGMIFVTAQKLSDVEVVWTKAYRNISSKQAIFSAATQREERCVTTLKTAV